LCETLLDYVDITWNAETKVRDDTEINTF